MIGGIGTIVAGILRYVQLKTGTYTIHMLHKEHDSMKQRISSLEGSVISMEASVEGKISSQIEDLKEDIKGINRKMDTLVREVVTAVTTMGKK
jgi:predicted  nucleic acid-binding Zn-ribbon protein